MAKELKDLTKRSENYSQWYNDLVVKADLAEQSPVRYLGEDAAHLGRYVQGNRTRKRVLPVADSEIIPEP